jgi:hypothetical protein
MQLTPANVIRVHHQEITPRQAFAEQAAEAASPVPCTPLIRKQIAAQYAEARRWTEIHGPQALCTQLADLLQAARKPMSACRLARLRRAFLAAAKAAGFTPGSAGVPPASRPPASLELRRQAPTATHAYLIGKGPSLDQLTPTAFPIVDAPILCCNESIHAVEALDLPNPLFCVQQDTSLAQRCRPGRATWFLSAQAWNAGQGDTYERAVKYTPKDLGLKTKNLTARAALCIIGKAGGFGHVHFRAFDACVSGDCGYADSIGESPTKRRKNGRRFVGFCKEIDRQATNANLTQHWPTSLPQSPSPQSPITDHQSQMSPPWTVACVLRTGGDFLPDHVLWLQAQCRARIKDPFRFVCLTDLPEIPGVETIPLQHDWPRWWPKIELFRPDLFPGPVAFFDLDMVILRDLVFPDPDTLPNRGIAVHRDLRNRKNIGSALMLWNQGSADFLYLHFADSATDFMRTYKGDQDYIHGSLVDNGGRELTPPWTWASYKWHIKAHGPDGFDIAAFHGKPRPWDVREPWIPTFPPPQAMPSRHGESPFTPTMLQSLAEAGLRIARVDQDAYRERLAEEQAKPTARKPLPPVGPITLGEFGNGHLGDTISTSRLPRLLAKRGYMVHVVETKSTRAVFTGNPHVAGFGKAGPQLQPWFDPNARGHVAQRFARALGLPENEDATGELHLSDAELSWARTQRAAWPIDKPVVIVSTGAVSSQQAYLGMDWQAIVDALAAECTVVAPIVTDREVHAGTRNSAWQKPGIPDFRPEGCVVYENLPTRQFMALFSVADGGLGTMGGASHIAGALDVPYLVVLPTERPASFNLGFPLLGESGDCDARWLYPHHTFAYPTEQPGEFPLSRAEVMAQIIHPDERATVPAGQLTHIVSKYLLARKHQPRRIVEVGVRYGYSAAAWLLACPKATYLGLDIIATRKGTHGGLGRGTNTFPYVRSMLARLAPSAQIELIHANSQQMPGFPPADFYHIDGDHTAAGALADIDKAFSACGPGGVIVVDDYDLLAPVRTACDQFAKDHAVAIAKAGRFPSWRGEFVIEKNEGATRRA